MLKKKLLYKIIDLWLIDLEFNIVYDKWYIIVDLD